MIRSSKLKELLFKHMAQYNYTKLGDYLIIDTNYLNAEQYNNIIKTIGEARDNTSTGFIDLNKF